MWEAACYCALREGRRPACPSPDPAAAFFQFSGILVRTRPPCHPPWSPAPPQPRSWSDLCQTPRRCLGTRCRSWRGLWCRDNEVRFSSSAPEVNLSHFVLLLSRPRIHGFHTRSLFDGIVRLLEFPLFGKRRNWIHCEKSPPSVFFPSAPLHFLTWPKTKGILKKAFRGIVNSSHHGKGLSLLFELRKVWFCFSPAVAAELSFVW